MHRRVHGLVRRTVSGCAGIPGGRCSGGAPSGQLRHLHANPISGRIERSDEFPFLFLFFGFPCFSNGINLDLVAVLLATIISVRRSPLRGVPLRFSR